MIFQEICVHCKKATLKDPLRKLAQQKINKAATGVVEGKGITERQTTL